MLFRFSLYGFLKNQRYFEPFLVLAFLEKGLTFFQIGLLFAFREVVVNLVEIPSGAVADLWGRRRSLILSFSAYVLSFLVFGWAEHLALLFAAMFCFGLGEAFRTGTHKAMIFRWLRLEGRSEERTRIYGFTRSWSKIGSAVSVLIAAVLVLWTQRYTTVFYLAVIPYLLGIVNFLGYPRELDGEEGRERGPRDVARHLAEAFGLAWRNPRPRRLLEEAMGYEGVFHSVKDYLQPILQAVAVAGWGSWLASDGSEIQRTALLVGPVYFVLYLLSAAASRHAYQVVAAAGDEEAAARRLWGGTAVLFGVITLTAWKGMALPLVVAFVLLHVVQNLWRPILVARFDQLGEESRAATILSLESQARRVVVIVAAPLLGLAVDRVGGAFWPVGLLGLVASGAFFLASRRGGSTQPVAGGGMT